MVNKRAMGGMVAALSFFFVFPALASAHLLAVSAGPSHCVTPLNGQYTATVTVTETYFGGTTEDIPVGQNVYEVLASSTDKGNTGKNQNYFTHGRCGHPERDREPGPADDFHLAGQRWCGDPAVHRHDVGSGDLCARQQLHELAVERDDHRAVERLHASASADVSDRRHAGERQVRPADELPSGTTLSGGVCVPPTTCPSGQTLAAGCACRRRTARAGNHS